MNNLKKIIIIWLMVALPLFAGASDEKGDKKPQADQKAEKCANITAINTNMDIPIYKPPLRGSPAGRVWGGTRGANERESFSLQVLTPDHIGLTVNDQPSLYWYVSKPVPHSFELTVIERHAVKPLIEKVVKGPGKGGIQAIHLADYNVHLRRNIPYKWFVTFVVDADHRSKDILAGGIIISVEPPTSFSAKLKAADASRLPYIYAEEGYWYDAIESISDMIDASPDNMELHKKRAALLEQVGLSEVAAFENKQTK